MNMSRTQQPSEFLNYLATRHLDGEAERIPPLSELSKDLGVSVSVLREQLEAAQVLGLVEARPRTGIRRLPYSFFPAANQSLAYALRLDPKHFLQFADLRKRLEAAYWEEAVRALTPQDHDELRILVLWAWEKLRGHPVRIPHEEHRKLHLCIYRRLDNPFVVGLLEAYWDAYEAVGLNVFADYEYLSQVWTYHQEMVDAICAGNIQQGYEALLAHTELIRQLPIPGA
jgi:DNA-binding FadR family transcriptional regulator